MKSFKFMCFVVLAGVIGASNAGVKQGDFEAGAALTISEPDEGDGTSFIFGNFGYMFTDAWEAKVAASIFEFAGDISGSIGPGVDYLNPLGTNSLVLFTGASYQLNLGEGDPSDFIDLHVGLKQFVSERTSIQYQLQRLEAIDSEDNQPDLSSFNVSIGINFYF